MSDYPESYDHCDCGSGERFRNLYDGYGIYLCKVCSSCEEGKKGSFRDDIFDRYDCDEDIDSD